MLVFRDIQMCENLLNRTICNSSRISHIQLEYMLSTSVLTISLILSFYIYLTEVIKGKLIQKEGEDLTEEALKGKVIGIYFSAHWVSYSHKRKSLMLYNEKFEIYKTYLSTLLSAQSSTL